MTYQLLREIRDAIAELTSQMALRNPAVEDETEEDAFLAPSLHIGALPPKRARSRENEDFPFVVVRSPSGEDQQDYAEATVEIICGIYTAEDEAGGSTDIHNLIDRIRGMFLQRRILAQVWELQLPLSWTTGSDEERNQPHPYYLGQITASWRAVHQAVLQDVDTEVDVYGSGLMDE